MVSILDELIDKLKSFEFSIPVKDVREPYSTKNPVYPMILVEEVRNSPEQQICGQIIRTNLAYKFDIYARDISVESLKTKREVLDILMGELDSIMRETYGMKQSGEYTTLPYTSDGSILRRIITYGGIIDNETKIIYQR